MEHRLLQALGEWIIKHPNADELEIIVKIWDTSDDTWYAGIRKESEGALEYGESTFGSESIDAALRGLCKELGLA